MHARTIDNSARRSSRWRKSENLHTRTKRDISFVLILGCICSAFRRDKKCLTRTSVLHVPLKGFRCLTLPDRPGKNRSTGLLQPLTSVYSFCRAQSDKLSPGSPTATILPAVFSCQLCSPASCVLLVAIQKCKHSPKRLLTSRTYARMHSRRNKHTNNKIRTHARTHAHTHT